MLSKTGKVLGSQDEWQVCQVIFPSLVGKKKNKGIAKQIATKRVILQKPTLHSGGVRGTKRRAESYYQSNGT